MKSSETRTLILGGMLKHGFPLDFKELLRAVPSALEKYINRDVIGCWEKNLNSERKHASSEACELENLQAWSPILTFIFGFKSPTLQSGRYYMVLSSFFMNLIFTKKQQKNTFFGGGGKKNPEFLFF